MGHGNIYTHILPKKNMFSSRDLDQDTFYPMLHEIMIFLFFFERLIDVVRPVFLRVRKARSL